MVTLADKVGQYVIMECIYKVYPDLCIRGEEDLTNFDVASVGPLESLKLLDLPMEVGMVPDGVTTPDLLKKVPIENICLFLDPVDGTLECVQGRLWNVQSLIGISVRNRAVAGIVGLPFHENTPIIYGLVDGGKIQNLNVQHDSFPPVLEKLDEKLVICTSKHAKEPAVRLAIEDLKSTYTNSEILAQGAAGNKLLQVLRGAANVSINNLAGCLWDACAYDALFKCAGGRLTDLAGGPILYHHEGAVKLDKGVLATGPKLMQDVTHECISKVCRCAGGGIEMAKLFNVEVQVPQAVDVFRDFNGQVFSTEKFSKMFGANINHLDVPESDAVRYLMSHACRVNLPNEITYNGISFNSTFFKICCLHDLPHVKYKLKNNPEKIVRDVKSYIVEVDFLSSPLAKVLIENDVQIPACYHNSIHKPSPNENILDFSCWQFLQDFKPADGWLQYGVLEESKLKASLGVVAKLHACCWQGTNTGNVHIPEEDIKIWDAGSHWYKERQSPDLLTDIAIEWHDILKRFAPKFDSYDENLGIRLGKLAEKVSAQVWACALDKTHAWRTVIHGDAKCANFFFRTKTNDTNYECALIDFQWTGWGNCCSDLVYQIATCIVFDDEYTTYQNDYEKYEIMYLKYYYTLLSEQLVHFGKATSIQDVENSLCPWDAFLKWYDLAFIDILPTIFGYHWKRIKASPTVFIKNKDNINKAGYNKSMRHAYWLVAKADFLINKYEPEFV